MGARTALRAARRANGLRDGILSLRAFRREDCDGTYLRWLRDPEVVRFVRFPTPDARAARRYVAEALTDPATHFFTIRLGRRKIGTIKLRVDGDTAELGVMIGAKHVWGQGYGRRAILLACRWAFERLGLKAVTAGIEIGNVASVKAFKRAGFDFWKEGEAWPRLKLRP